MYFVQGLNLLGNQFPIEYKAHKLSICWGLYVWQKDYWWHWRGFQLCWKAYCVGLDVGDPMGQTRPLLLLYIRTVLYVYTYCNRLCCYYATIIML